MSAAEIVIPPKGRVSRYLQEIGRDLSFMNKDGGHVVRDYWRNAAVIFFSVLALALLLLPNEMTLLHWMQGDKSGVLYFAAKQISRWGDFHTGTLMFAVSFWLIGMGCRKRHWRRAALACLLSASLAGISADFFRYGLGRARPNSGVADGFYGFTTSAKFHGFPSGHTSTAFGSAVPLAVIFPEAAIPAIAVAATVGWSRLYVNYHRPTDVLVGASVGTLFGIAVGLAVRRRSRSDKSSDPALA